MKKVSSWFSWSEWETNSPVLSATSESWAVTVDSHLSPTSRLSRFSPAFLLPSSVLLFAFPLFSWFRKVLEAIGCLHLCLSLTAPYSPLSRSQGLWWPSLPLGHCSVVILVSSRLSISLDSMYFLFCIILNSFLLDNDFHHTHSFAFPVLESSSIPA